MNYNKEFVYAETFTGVFGGNLSEERFPPYPLPKTFNTNFSPTGCIQ